MPQADTAQHPIMELRQTRELTEAERTAMCRIWRGLVMPKADCWFCDNLRYAFECGLWLLVIVTMGAIDRLRAIDPALAILFAVTGFGLPLLVLAGRWRNKRLARQWQARDIGMGDRYTIEADGLRRRHGGLTMFCPWPVIEAMTQDADHLVAHIAPVYSLQLAKDAFAGQDVAGFCAQLERRWWENRPSHVRGLTE